MDLVVNKATSSSSQPQFDVFLSYDQEDTAIKSFTDFLYDALKQKGFQAFNNNKTYGQRLRSDIFKTIKESRISIIIFSKMYASSIDCLDELLAITESSLVVLPIFYDINPSDVRKQSGDYVESFSKHGADFGDKKLEKWRYAMTGAANLSGFTLMQFNGYERELIGAIVKDISSKLIPMVSSNALTELVGIDSRLEELRMKMDLESDEVHFVGIHGMGGIGKTTLARAFCKQMSCHFDATCFLANVREGSQQGGLVSYQEQLLSQILNETSNNKIWNTDDGVDQMSQRFRNRKVLIVIDDVDNIDQLSTLAGDCDWFGKGSRIIITTRDEHLLTAHRVHAVYRAELLNLDEALQLLCLNAFKNRSPPDTKYWQLCINVVECVKGLPLALKVLGSFLYKRSVHEWEATLERLKENPDKDILDCLRISYDSLEKTEKKIFLDIAFFFKGMDKDEDYVIEILKSCNLYPKIGVKVLIEKSLVSLSDNKFLMHDLLVDMAKKIVEIESPNDLGKRSWLCKETEVHNVLSRGMGTEAVEGITNKFGKEQDVSLPDTAFANMKKLRVLKISNVKLPRGLHYLSNELRLFEWHRYPSTSLPLGFHPHGIVVLKLLSSRIQHLWEGLKVLDKLKVIDLSFSENLTEMPNVEGVPNLEILRLEGCRNLSKVDPSVGHLKKLKTLNLRQCSTLSILPSFVSLISLEACDLTYCSKLANFPQIKGRMDSLMHLAVEETAIENFDSSLFHFMKNLKRFSFGGRNRNRKPRSFTLYFLRDLHCLTELNLSYCKLDEKAFSDALLGQLSSLKVLVLTGSDFVSLPPFISLLSNLEYLNLSSCKRLKSLTELPPKLMIVQVLFCPSLEEWLEQLYFQEFGSNSHFEDFISKAEMTANPHIRVHMSSMNYRYGGRNFSLLHEKWTRFYQIRSSSEIPEDYMYQMEGDSISIDEPALHCDSRNRKVVGLVACFVVGMDEDILAYPMPALGGNYFGPCRLGLHLTINNDIPLSLSIFSILTEEAVGKDYLWVVGIPEYQIYRGCNVKFQFFRNYGIQQRSGTKVKRCGVRPVYQNDSDSDSVSDFSGFFLTLGNFGKHIPSPAYY